MNIIYLIVVEIELTFCMLPLIYLVNKVSFRVTRKSQWLVFHKQANLVNQSSLSNISFDGNLA